MTVRALGPADGDALVACVAEVLPRTWSGDAIQAELAREDARIFGAEVEGALAGFAMLRLGVDEAELLLIGVRAAARRRGLAAELWRVASSALAREGVGAVFLEVRASNAPARAFYARAGFAEVGRRRDYYAAPVEDALVLSRTIADRDPRGADC